MTVAAEASGVWWGLLWFAAGAVGGSLVVWRLWIKASRGRVVRDATRGQLRAAMWAFIAVGAITVGVVLRMLLRALF